MKNLSLVIVAALLTVSASAPVEVASATTAPVTIQYVGSSGATL